MKPILDTVKGYARCFSLEAKRIFHRKSPSESKNLLLLAWHFPPAISGGVYRPLSFVKTAASQGWKVSVFSGPLPDAPSEAGQYLADALPEGIGVYPVSPSTLAPSYKLFPRVDGGFTTAIETAENVIVTLKEPPTVILASGPPFHNFIAGWYLSRYYRIPLVLDYRDEWTDCPFHFVRLGNCDRYWEHKCLKQAARVFFTTRSFISQSKSSFPGIDHAKYQLLPNGYAKGDIATQSSGTNHTGDAIFRIAFLGALSAHTPPDTFLDTVGKLITEIPEWRQKLKILFVGSRQADVDLHLRQHKMADIIEIIDQVEKPKAIQIMREVDALLLLNPEPLNRYIPGKLFDYIASGTPILVFGKGGEAAAIVDELNTGVIVGELSPDQLDAALTWIMKNGLTSDPEKRENWLENHEREILATALLTELNNLSN